MARDVVIFSEKGLVSPFCYRQDRYKRTIFHVFLKLDNAVDKRKQRMIFSYADIQPGIMNGAALTNNDVAGFGKLPAINLNT